MKKALVTGGQGFIGGHLVDKLVDEKYDVVVIDNQSSTSSDFHVNAKASYLNRDVADITLYQELFETHGRFDQVFHLAALADIVPSIDEPEKYYKTNVTGTLNVLKLSLIRI